MLFRSDSLRASRPGDAADPVVGAMISEAFIRYLMSVLVGARYLMERELLVRLSEYILAHLTSAPGHLKISTQCRVRLVSPMEAAESHQYDAPCIGMTRVFMHSMTLLQVEEQVRELLAELITMMAERSYDANSGMFILGVTELSLFMARVAVLPAGSSYIPTPPAVASRKDRKSTRLNSSHT